MNIHMSKNEKIGEMVLPLVFLRSALPDEKERRMADEPMQKGASMSSRINTMADLDEKCAGTFILSIHSSRDVTSADGWPM